MTVSRKASASIDPNAYKPEPYVKLQHPEWCKDATIYQINTRQFTPEGTFRAAEAHLPRLKELGVRILWLMPVQEIGEKNRKGSLGSPYAIRDYYSVNPEFGTADDLKHFIDAAHAHGFYVILDWVANHTSWDNPLVEEHPEWYDRDWDGNFRPTPWWDWTDIIDFDYDNLGLRLYMAEAMLHWVQEYDFDGFRCDVAGLVPLDFWNAVRADLEKIKPVFMLAEWETRDIHARAFDAGYAWTWHNALKLIAKGQADTSALYVYYSGNESGYPHDSIRMTFLSNHDKNAWNGTEFETFGDAVPAAMVLSATGDGMPLIYNGQEAGNPKRLAFFERDPIEWRPHPNGELYKKLVALKKANSALWNGHWGATMYRVPNSVDKQVFSFVRRNDDNKVFVAINFSGAEQRVVFEQTLCHGTYTDYFSGEACTVDDSTQLSLPPWGYKVFVQ